MSISHFPKAKRMALPNEFQSQLEQGDVDSCGTWDTSSVHSSKSSPGYIANRQVSGSTGGPGSAKSSISRYKAKKLQPAANAPAIEKNGDIYAAPLKTSDKKDPLKTGRNTVSKMEGIDIGRDVNYNSSRKAALASVDGNWVMQDIISDKKNNSRTRKPDNSRLQIGDNNNNATGGVHYDEEGRLVGAPVSKRHTSSTTSGNNNSIPINKPLPKGAASVLVDPALYRISNGDQPPPTPSTPQSDNSSVFASVPSTPTSAQVRGREPKSIDDYFEQKQNYEARVMVQNERGNHVQSGPSRFIHRSVNGYTQEPQPVVLSRRPVHSDGVLLETGAQMYRTYHPGQHTVARVPPDAVLVRPAYQQVVDPRMVQQGQVVRVLRQPGLHYESEPNNKFIAKAQVRHPMKVLVPPKTPPSPGPQRYVMSTVPRNFRSGITAPPALIQTEETAFQRSSFDDLDSSLRQTGQTVSVQVPSYTSTTQDNYNKPVSSGTLVKARRNFHSDPNLLKEDKANNEDLYDKIPGDETPRIEAKVEYTPQVTTVNDGSLIQHQAVVHAESDVIESEDNEPRVVVLQRGKGGFGFVLRGAKSHDSTTRALEFTPTNEFPALQYLDRVEQGSPADKAGLKPGDFLLEINQENVSRASHEHTVNLIKKSGTTLAMKVMTVKSHLHEMKGNHIHMDGTATLPLKRRAAPTPPTRAPGTSLTMTKTQGLSVAEGVVALDAHEKQQSHYDEPPRISTNTLGQANKTASIGRHHGKRMTSIEMNDIFARESMAANTEGSASNQARPVVSGLYNSSPEGNSNNSHITRVDIGAHKRQNGAVDSSYVSSGEESSSQGYGSDHKTAVYAVPTKVQSRPARSVRKSSLESSDSSGGSVNISQKYSQFKNKEPEPDYPSPNSSDVTEVVKISTKSSPYASISKGTVQHNSDIESSFRPGADARLSKEPEVVVTRSRTSSGSSNRSGSRIQSNAEVETGTAFAVTATAIAANHKSVSDKYFEPAPDYQANITPHSSSPTAPPAPAEEPVSPTPDYDEEEKSVSDFNNAIKLAALKREKRRTEQPVEQQIDNLRQIKSTAPPPPKSPPPNENVWPRPVKSVPTREPSTSNLPPHLQKQMEEDKKREQGHNDLMAAIAKRRTVVENRDMASVANNIEKQVQKNKSVQSTVYTVGSSNPPSHTTEMTKTKTSTKETAKTDSMLIKEITVQKSEPEIGKTTITQEATETPPKEISSEEQMDFAAIAEKKRQEWLLKRAASTSGTLEKPVKKKEVAPSPPSTSMNGTPPPPTTNNILSPPASGTPPPPPIPAGGITPKEQPRTEPVKREPVKSPAPVKSNPSGMADFANIVAQKAMSRQKSEVDDPRSTGTTIFSSVGNPKSPRSPTSPKPVELKPVQKRSSVEIRGATTSYSHTEMPKKAPAPEKPSVMTRSKALEGRAPRPGQTGNKMVFKAKPTSPTEKPPPMIPASSKGSYSHQSKVVNGVPEFSRSAHVATIKDEDIPIVPPPPAFEVEQATPSKTDDSMSMVSDVSSLSSLSSMAHDSPNNSSRTGTYDVAPPPPGFDDGDFVPPPTEFAGEAGQPNLKSIKRSSGGHSISFPAVSNPKAFHSKRMNTWSVDDVGHWLDSVNMSQYKTIFNRRNVTGAELAKMGRRDFSSMGITHVGQRMDLENAIRKAIETSSR